MPSWATGIGGNSTPNPEITTSSPPSHSNPPTSEDTYQSSTSTEYVQGSQGPSGPSGPRGLQGPPPSNDQILDCLKKFEKLKEKGYKIPSNYEPLISEAKSRKIIVGFATTNGIEWKWGRDVNRSEMAQFVGRLLKVLDELESKMTTGDEKLRKELVALRDSLQQKLDGLSQRVEKLEKTGINGEKIIALAILGLFAISLFIFMAIMINKN